MLLLDRPLARYVRLENSALRPHLRQKHHVLQVRYHMVAPLNALHALRTMNAQAIPQ
jgi:hypothetical protein